MKLPPLSCSWPRRGTSVVIKSVLLVVSVNLFGLLSHYLLTSHFTESVDRIVAKGREIIFSFDFAAIFFLVYLIAHLFWHAHSIRNGEEPRALSINPILPLVIVGIILLPILSALLSLLVEGIRIFANIIASEIVIKYNFFLSLLLVFCFSAPALRLSVIRRQTWKKLKDGWLNWWTYKNAAALLFLAQGPFSSQSGLINKAMHMSQFDMETLSLVFIFSLLAAWLASQFHQTGLACAVNEESNVPMFYFFSSLILAILSQLGMGALTLNGIILTCYAHISKTLS